MCDRLRPVCREKSASRSPTLRSGSPALRDLEAGSGGGWDQPGPCEIAGKPRKLAKEKLISQLRQRHEQGQSLAWYRICLEDRAFATAVRSAYGSWRRALIAAGLESELAVAGGTFTWDQPRVLDAIRASTWKASHSSVPTFEKRIQGWSRQLDDSIRRGPTRWRRLGLFTSDRNSAHLCPIFFRLPNGAADPSFAPSLRRPTSSASKKYLIP